MRLYADPGEPQPGAAHKAVHHRSHKAHSHAHCGGGGAAGGKPAQVRAPAAVGLGQLRFDCRLLDCTSARLLVGCASPLHLLSPAPTAPPCLVLPAPFQLRLMLCATPMNPCCSPASTAAPPPPHCGARSVKRAACTATPAAFSRRRTALSGRWVRVAAGSAAASKVHV